MAPPASLSTGARALVPELIKLHQEQHTLYQEWQQGHKTEADYDAHIKILAEKMHIYLIDNSGGLLFLAKQVYPDSTDDQTSFIERVTRAYKATLLGISLADHSNREKT